MFITEYFVFRIYIWYTPYVVFFQSHQAQRAKSELEAASAEMKELRALSEGMCRVQTEGGKALREAGLANRHVKRLATENAALAGHNNSKQKIKHLQVRLCMHALMIGTVCCMVWSQHCCGRNTYDSRLGGRTFGRFWCLLRCTEYARLYCRGAIGRGHFSSTLSISKTTTILRPPLTNQELKKESIRLQNEKARQASDLALAIAVLEAVGVLPKEVRGHLLYEVAYDDDNKCSQCTVLGAGSTSFIRQHPYVCGAIHACSFLCAFGGETLGRNKFAVVAAVDCMHGG